MSHLYIINCNDEFYKIGKTRNIKYRLKQIQASCPYLLSLEKVIKNGYHLEKKAHSFFEKNRIRGEWFKLSKKQLTNFEKAFEVKE